MHINTGCIPGGKEMRMSGSANACVLQHFQGIPHSHRCLEAKVSVHMHDVHCTYVSVG
jgi:hypothetical protein